SKATQGTSARMRSVTSRTNYGDETQSYCLIGVRRIRANGDSCDIRTTCSARPHAGDISFNAKRHYSYIRCRRGLVVLEFTAVVKRIPHRSIPVSDELSGTAVHGMQNAVIVRKSSDRIILAAPIGRMCIGLSTSAEAIRIDFSCP